MKLTLQTTGRQRGWKGPRQAAERRQHAAGRRGVPQLLSAHPAAEKGGSAAPRGASVPGLAALTRRTCWCRRRRPQTRCCGGGRARGRLSRSRATGNRRWAAGAAPPGRPYPAAPVGRGARRASWWQRPRNDPRASGAEGWAGRRGARPNAGRGVRRRGGRPGEGGKGGRASAVTGVTAPPEEAGRALRRGNG